MTTLLQLGVYFTENSHWVPLKFARYNEVSLYRGFFYIVNPLLSPPPRNLFISNPFEGEGLNRDGGFNIFNLETTMASVLHKELEYKVEKLKYSKF